MSVAVFFSFVVPSASRNVATAGPDSKSDTVIESIDAGIIFSDQSNYLCIPLNRIGISSPSQIESIRTSCECVTASLVKYRENATKTVDAVRIDFVQETKNSPSFQAPAINLEVDVRILLSNGLTKSLPIRFVSAKFLDPDLSVKSNGEGRPHD